MKTNPDLKDQNQLFKLTTQKYRCKLLNNTTLKHQMLR